VPGKIRNSGSKAFYNSQKEGNTLLPLLILLLKFAIRKGKENYERL
jgi:hypothetical protein